MAITTRPHPYLKVSRTRNQINTWSGLMLLDDTWNFHHYSFTKTTFMKISHLKNYSLYGSVQICCVECAAGTYKYVYMNICMCIHVCVHIHTCIWSDITYTRMYIHMYSALPLQHCWYTASIPVAEWHNC